MEFWKFKLVSQLFTNMYLTVQIVMKDKCYFITRVLIYVNDRIINAKRYNEYNDVIFIPMGNILYWTHSDLNYVTLIIHASTV